MNAGLIALVPLLPLLSALSIGVLHFFRVIDGEAGEKATALIALTGSGLSALLALILSLADWLAPATPNFYPFGSWLRCGNIELSLSLAAAGYPLWLSALFAWLLLIAIKFSINYLHREAGYHRFFFVMSLFAAAMQLLVLAGNALFTFIGWELAGLCSYLLIGYAYERPTATENAVRVFVTNRLGDAGFLLAIGLALVWLESADWSAINDGALGLASADATLLALALAWAAFAKSAQIPFTPWLARAMEGPTPSSAVFYGGVMIHAGVFLLIRSQTLFEQAPLAMAILLAVGALTAIHGYWVGLTQTDIKSSQIYSASVQLGLMFVECGMGFWNLAAWHLAGHAVLRCYLLLIAPSILYNTQGRPMRPLDDFLARRQWAFSASLQRWWLEPIQDWLLVEPIKGLAKDASYLEQNIIDPALGIPAPAMQAISSLAHWEERKLGANLESNEDSFAQGSGLAGKLAQWSAALSGWFEYRFILRGIGRDTIHWGRRLGHAANRFEQLLLRPRYLLLFVAIVVLVAVNR